MLSDMEAQNYPLYLQLLCHELTNDAKPAESRQLASVLLKNTMSAKEAAMREQKIQKYLGLDMNLRTQIKQAVLGALNANIREARTGAAQIISQIAYIELPRHMWPDLITILLSNMDQQSDILREASLETLGFICEEIEPDILTTQANQILTAICKGIKDPNAEIKFYGCQAMYDALAFAKQNFEKENERNYIMQVLCDCAVPPEVEKVRTTALQCIVQIASLYYEKLSQYMQKIFSITLESIKKESPEICLQAIEFWSTVCEEEIEIEVENEEAAEMKIETTRQSQNFIRGALKYLVPLLAETLSKQEDEPDEDNWTPAMAAGACLSLVAECVCDEIVPVIMPFIEQNITNPNWKFREAATLAFGAILEGPKTYLPTLITQALPVLLSHMRDPVIYVKDTTAWTIGRICEFHPETVTNSLQNVITILVEALQDSPKVASNACYALHSLAKAYEGDIEKNTSALSPYYQGLLEKLFLVTEREDADESNLLPTAYEAVNVLIQCGAQDVFPTIAKVVSLLCDRLEKTFSIQILTVEDRDRQYELQSHLCSSLQISTQKLGASISPVADRMMLLFLQLFNEKNANVHEEALMAVGAIVNAVESNFEKYMPHFKPFLIAGLRNYEEFQICSAAVGVVGDLTRALNMKMLPYCDEIVSILLQDLQSPQLNRSVKPPILSCFGDIALAIGREFLKYLGVVMNMLQQASVATVDTNDPELVDWLNQLREGIFEAYTGIIQGLRGDNVANPNLLPFVPHIVNFAGFVFSDPQHTETVMRGAVGVLGDIAHSVGPLAKTHLQLPFVKNIIQECCKSEDSQTKDTAIWAKEVIGKL